MADELSERRGWRSNLEREIERKFEWQGPPCMRVGLELHLGTVIIY